MAKKRLFFLSLYILHLKSFFYFPKKYAEVNSCFVYFCLFVFLYYIVSTNAIIKRKVYAMMHMVIDFTNINKTNNELLS